MGDIIIVRQNADLQLNYALKVGPNQSTPLPGTIRYNSTYDRIEGYLTQEQSYNNSNWAPMTLGIASPTDLGGVKIGNNLTITDSGVMSAVAGAPSRQFQRVISVCQRDNTGDYTSIQDCLSGDNGFFGYQFTGSPVVDWTTSTGALAGLHADDPVNFPWPDASNLYIIQVSPGVYLENNATIRLPPYVVLQGDITESVVIRNNPVNGVMINPSTGSIIERITVDMSASNLLGETSGILCDINASYVQLRDITLATSNLSQSKYGINIIGSSQTTISGLAANINLPTAYTPTDLKELVLVKASGANNLVISNADLSITSNQNTKTGFQIIDNTTARISQTKISIQELNQNYALPHKATGVIIQDSAADLVNCQISVLGLDNKDTEATSQLCQGIRVIDTVAPPPIYTPMGAQTEFIHYNNFDDNDEIKNTAYNWQTTAGFKIGDYLSAIAPINLTSANRSIFQIRGFAQGGSSSYTMQLDNSVSLDDQTFADGVVSFQKYNNIGIYNSRITSASQTIYVANSGAEGANFRIQSVYSVLDGQNPELGNAHFILTVPQQITVGLQDCDFLSLADACDSIKDSGPSKPYEILVQPGLFIERRTVRIPSYVSVVGQGQNITILKFEQADIGSAPYDILAAGITNTAIVLGTDNQNYYAGLSGMSVQIPSGLNNKNTLDTQITGIRVAAILGARLADISLNMGFSTSTPIDLNSSIKGINIAPSNIVLTVKYQIQRVNVEILSSTQGLDIRGFSATTCSYAALTDCRVSIYNIVSLPNRMVYGIWADRSKLDITAPYILLDIDGNAPSGAGYGVLSTDTTITPPAPTGSTTYSETPVIIYGGQVRTTGIVGDVLYSVFADYASTLFALNSAVQGTAASRNDLLDTYPNSLLKTYKCYYFSSDGNSFINVGDLDPAGNEMGGTNDNLNVGDPVGVAEMFGTKNVQVGIRTGTFNQAGNRNTMLGVDVGRQINTGNNNVLLGYAAGNNIVASNTTLVGAYCGQNLTGSSSQEIVMMGTDAGAAATSAVNTVIIGAKTAKSVVGAAGSTVIGSRTASSATGLTDTIIIGGNTATGLGTSTRDILIGTDSVNVLGASTDNLVIGTRAAEQTTAMTTSVLLGNESGKNRLTTQESVLVGFGAGAGSSGTIVGNTGQRNVALGHQSAAGLSSGSDNFIAGARAASQITTGSYNTIIGSGQTAQTTAGGSLTSGSYNLIAGTNTANSLTTGSKNMVLGSQSGNKLTTQTDTFILGYNSGGNLTNSTSIIIGNESGKQVSDGGALIIGHGSGTNAGGSDLLIIGHNCARGLTGARNTIIGNYGAGASGAVVLSGTDNVLIGAYAGFQLTTGSHNVLIGSGDQTNSTGRSLTAGSGNMIFGYQTAPQLSSGSDNLIFGKQSAYNLAAGNRNIYLGAEAGSQMSSSSENVIIGNEAGRNLSSGTGIVLIGNRAGYNATGNGSVSDNLFIGNEAGYSITTGSQNTIIGNQTGHAETTGFRNTYIGNFAAQNLTAANRNICVGYFAGAGIDPVASKNSEDNIMMGSFAGQKITQGYQNILIGTHAGSNIQARTKNIMIGPYVGAESNASLNIFIGGTTSNASDTGRSIGYWANGNYNIVLGTNAGLDLASAERNIIMGFAAGEKVNSGSKNIIMGQMAGNRLTTGNNNILVGQNTGVSISGAIGLQTGNNVIAIGTRAGGNIGSAVNDSILIGTEAGFKTQVDNAICIGPSAGAQNMTGVGGISIGYRAGLSSVAAEGCISIGSNAGAAFTGTTQVGQNISIGDEAATNNQGTRNIVIGAEAATNSSNASNVIVIGYQAGYGLGGLPSSTGINPDNSIVVGFRAAGDGDIGADNIIVGTQAAKSVDNPRVFTRNIVIGANAARVSNLAVDSIILGQAGQSGTGGVKNILMGSGAGSVLGNPLPIYPLTTEPILAEAGGANISMNYDQARLYFREGDMLLIETPTASYQTQIGGIINPAEYANDPLNSSLNAIARLVFTQPYPSGATTIESGAMVRSLANLDTGNVGLVDESKAGGNSLVGESAGGQLTTGSKSVAFGTGALAANQTAKYNNAIGTEAAHNAISDNNTCLGTRAGYSIDLYDGLTYESNAVSFTPNTNTITYGGGFVVPTDEFRFGTVFDVSGSTLNDGRYTVYSANTTSVVVNGIPKYEALGVPLNVSAEDLRVNSATFTFDQVVVNGVSAGGIAVAKDPFGVPGNTQSRIYSLASGTWSALANTNVFRITGSRYNDGVYYKATDTSSSSNSYVIYGQFHPEIFDANVSISATSINSTDTITNGVSFNDYQVDMPFYAFFGQNKGTYKIGNQLGTQQPTQSKYSLARPLSNCALVSTNSIIPSVGEDNIVFTTGYQEIDSMAAATLIPAAISTGYQNHYSFRKYQIFGQVDIYTSNATMYFTNAISKLVADLANASIFCLDCPSADNDKLLFQITSSPDNNTLNYEVIRGTTSAPVDETITATATGNPMYLTHAMIKNLDRDVSGTFSNLGFVKLSASYNMGMDTHTGDYLIDTVLGNNIVLADDQVLPIMASNLGSVQILPTGFGYNLAISGQVETTIAREYLGMEASYLFDPKISGTDIMIQSGQFNPTADPSYSYTISNTTKTIIADKDYVFSAVVAPCVIRILGQYFLVVANDYPFRTLKIDPTQDLSSITSATTELITYNSISSHSGYIQFDNLIAGTQYEILGGGDNNRLIVSPLAATGAITKQSVYVSNTAPMITNNTNKTVLGVYSPTEVISTSFNSRIRNQITPRGYFKRMYQPTANLSITLNSSNGYYEPLKGYSGYNGNMTAVSGDKIVIQPSITQDKYSLNNVGANSPYEPMSSGLAYTFWDTANSDVFETITLPASNTVSVYGEQFDSFKISSSGFLVFEGAANVHTINFQTTNDPVFSINSARMNSNVNVKYINDGNSTDGADNVIVINYATNNAGITSGWGKSADNNLELRVYMDNTGNSAGRITLNYSDTLGNIGKFENTNSNLYIVLGIESTRNTVDKETRYTVDLPNVAINANTVITSYYPSSPETGNTIINLNSNTYLYSQKTSNTTNTYSFSAPPVITGSNFGNDVDIWGQQMIIGAKGDGVGVSGNVFIYSSDATEYKGYLYSDSVDNGPSSQFGYAVGLFGNRALVGAPGNNSNAGNVFVFDWDGTSWINTANLSGPPLNGPERFGSSIDMYDANTIVIGAPAWSTGGITYGSIYVYEYNSPNWTLNYSYSGTASGNITPNFGSAVAMNNGNVIIGAPDGWHLSYDTGYVQVINSTLPQVLHGSDVGRTIPASNSTPYYKFGQSVAINDEYLAVGYPGHYGTMSSNAGAVYLYKYNTGSWAVSQVISSPTITTFFGYDVSLNANGINATALYISSTPFSGLSSVRGYALSGLGTWYSTGELYTNTGANGFGSSISSWYNKFVIGAPLADTNLMSTYTGLAHISSVDTLYSNYISQISPSFRFYPPSYGYSLDITNSLISVGNPIANVYGSNGVVWLYDINNGVYDLITETYQLQPDNLGSYSNGIEFGTSVAVDEDWLIVGAQKFNTATTTGSGRVYIYETNNYISGSYNQINPPAPETNGNFGNSVDMENGRIVIGARGENSGQGNVYVYDFVSTNWVQSVNSPITVSGSTGFGDKVKIQNNCILVGSSDTPGKVYLFKNGDLVSSPDDLVPNLDTPTVDYGGALDINDRFILISDKTQNAGLGAVYIFERINNQFGELVSGNTYSETLKLSGSRLGFGFNVVLGQDILIVSDAPSSGADYFYVYKYQHSVKNPAISWQLVQTVDTSTTPVSRSYGTGFAMYNNVFLATWPSFSVSGDGIIRPYLYDYLPGSKYQLTRSAYTNGYYIPDWQTHTPTSTDLEIINLGSNIVSIHGQQSNTIAISKWGFLYSDKTQYVSLVEPLNGHYFNSAYWQVDNNILTATFVDTTTSPNVIIQVNLYTTNSRYANNMEITYLNLEQLITGGGQFTGYSGLSHNLYNSITLGTIGGIDNSATTDIAQTANLATLTFNSPNASVLANIALIQNQDIIRIQGMSQPANNGYFTVMSPVANTGTGGDYYMTIRHTGITPTVEEFDVIAANTTINEFRSYSEPSPSSANADIDFMNLYSSYGNTVAFLRFAKCYQSPVSNITSATVGNVSVIESSLNYTAATWNNSNVVSNVAVGLMETVPAEYSTGLSLPLDLDNYLVALGTPVPDSAGNTIVEQRNIKTPPTGYIHNYMYRDLSTNSNLVQSPSYLFSSNLTKISWGGSGVLGNISIASGNITLSALDSAGGATGGLIDLGLGRWDYGFKDVITKPFAGVKPGMLLNISNSGGYSANVMVANTVIGPGGELLSIQSDSRFSNLANIGWNFATGGQELTIQLLSRDITDPNNIITSQLISDRINFAALSNSSPTNQTGSFIAKLPLVSYFGEIYNNKYSYMNNYSAYQNSLVNLPGNLVEDTNNIVKVLQYNIPSVAGLNNKWMIDDLGDRLWIVPRNKLVNENPYAAVLYFIRQLWINLNIQVSTAGGVQTLVVSSGTVDFTQLEPGVIIMITDNSVFTRYVQVSTIISSTEITLNTAYNPNVPIVDGTYTNKRIFVNIIGSYNTDTVNLAYFKPGQRVIVSKTGTSNDRAFNLSQDAPTTPECIFVDINLAAVGTIYPDYGVIERAMFGFEAYPLGYPGFGTTSGPGATSNTFTITSGSTSNVLATFKSGDDVEITSGTLNGTFTASSGQITQPYALILDGMPTGASSSAVSLTKSVAFRVIGKAISTTTDAGVVKFHYTDAQGNNIMIGSFTGQFAGATGLSIHNLFLGNKVGQTNQGSGNIFFGSETGFATDASQGATSYDNKLAIYKNNFIGVPSDPLIGGDFASGRVGVGTIDPDGKLLATLGERTLMVVDGKVRAEAYNTFTGTHFVILDIESEPVKPELGMVLSSRGRVHKLGLLDNIVECGLSTKLQDKRVYGVYAGDEMINGRQIAHCAAVGEGSILVATINGEPENGDYLCSSPIPGLAQLQPDDLLHNYTVAKLIEDVNWSAVNRYISYEGREYKVALVACSYHCA